MLFSHPPYDIFHTKGKAKFNVKYVKQTMLMITCNVIIDRQFYAKLKWQQNQILKINHHKRR